MRSWLKATRAEGAAGATSQDSLHLDATHPRLQKPAFSASGRLLAPERLWHRCVRAPLTWSRAPPTRAAPPRWCQKCDQSDKLMGRAGGKGPNSSCRPCIGYSLMSLPRPDLFGKAPHTLPRVRTKGEKKKNTSLFSPHFFFPFSLFSSSPDLFPKTRVSFLSSLDLGTFILTRGWGGGNQ